MKKLSVITLSNKGYIDYTRNLINSINTNNIDLKLNIFVMDKFSYKYFNDLNQNTFLIDGINGKKYLKQDSKDFGTYMLQKLKIIHQSLLSHEEVIYLDGDIVIKKNFLDNLNLIGENYDLLIQDDMNPKKPHIEYLCAGFMKIKSNKKTLEFFNPKNIPDELIMKGLHDQEYINVNKHMLNYLKLPLEHYPNGAHFYNNSAEIDPYIIHFNYVIGKKKKKLMKVYKEWYK